ncbi:hypothetical protein FRC03_003992 [Tulasnella sp. 419]|nr:hypothetical protein FRC03_003992 [Tulasnella sp. 419]
MPPNRVRPAEIGNKMKREEVYRKQKREKAQERLKRRLERAKEEKDDPEAKKRRLEKNVPKTLDNMREFDPSMLTANPAGTHPSASSSKHEENTDSSNKGNSSMDPESSYDISTDPFASYFDPESNTDPSVPPKLLITTSPKCTKASYEFCDELVGVFPGAEFIRRKKGKGFELGRIAGWAAGRGYSAMLVVNENTKQPNAITLVHLPNGPTAYFKLTSIQLTSHIFGHARASPHHPELVLNNFVTRLGHAVGRMFQTLFPPMPEFEGRQVVTLHNQRDFLFFRRHRYMFKSTEKAALQEIGPRFTLKLRWLKKGIPAVQNLGAPPPPLKIADDNEETNELENPADASSEGTSRTKTAVPTTEEEYAWVWKPELEVTRRTFFL